MPNFPIENVTIESVDRAIRDWFDKSVDARVETPEGLRKVPIMLSMGERWAVGRTNGSFRDNNGVLILPVISLRRVSITPDPSKTTLGTQVPFIQVAKLVDPKSNQIKNLEKLKADGRDYPPVYDVYTIPFPNGMIASYQLVIQTQFIKQMNQILERMWRSLDIQKQFVAPLRNDGRQAPADDQFDNAKPIDFPYVVGFIDNAASDSGNLEEFTDGERIIKYQTDISVPFVLQTDPNGEIPAIKVRRTTYKIELKDENWGFVDDPDDLDKIFGSKR